MGIRTVDREYAKAAPKVVTSPREAPVTILRKSNSLADIAATSILSKATSKVEINAIKELAQRKGDGAIPNADANNGVQTAVA